MSGSICGDPWVRTAKRCPTEGRVRPMAGVFGVYYGAYLTCLGCGDSWSDGELMQRPFKRAWRKESIRRAVEVWRQAVPLKQEVARQLAEWRADEEREKAGA